MEHTTPTGAAEMETSGVEMFGYTVEDQNNEAPGALAYMLTGKRGATYGLMRHMNHPHLMYVVRGRTGVICGLKGNYTFTDADGQLRSR
jgi:hypothetical protein